MVVSFQIPLIKTYVTSLKFSTHWILIGIGDFLLVYSKYNKQLISKSKIFDGENIQGIDICNVEPKVILFGGMNIATLTYEGYFTKLTTNNSKRIREWILDAKYIDESKKICTLVMNNKVYIWNSLLELEREVSCLEKCNLYSGHICFNSWERLIILSGTINGDLLVWIPSKKKEFGCQRLKGHKGVIFSLNFNKKNSYICSTSDDRSAILWNMNINSLTVDVKIICRTYGHTSRIFRCEVLHKCYLTTGEDSKINIWNFQGKLIRSISTRQGGIWSLNCYERENCFAVGGHDGGISMQPILLGSKKKKLFLPSAHSPQRLGLLKNHMVVISESGILYSYDYIFKIWKLICSHICLKKYAILEVSNCKKLVALAGYNGEIFIYKDVKSEVKQIHTMITAKKERIYSLHWLNCAEFMTCEKDGVMTIYSSKNNEFYANNTFILSLGKERLSSTACLMNPNTVAVGDRNGNVYVFNRNCKTPSQTVKKVHNYLGVFKIYFFKSCLVSLGRDSLLKTLSFNESGELCVDSVNKLPFSWLAYYNERILLAFSNSKVILWDVHNRRVLYEHICGGGHRSWSFIINSGFLNFGFIKDKTIYIIETNLQCLLPKDLSVGFHVNQINALKVFKIKNRAILLSGGEDTVLCLSTIHLKDKSDVDLFTPYSYKSHLSSIRCFTTYTLSSNILKKMLIISAGGRSQIILWLLTATEDVNNKIKINFSEKYSYIDSTNNKPENRIMDMTVVCKNDRYSLFAACSDGNIKFFDICLNNSNFTLKLISTIHYNNVCLLKLTHVAISSANLLASMATDGYLIFWDIDNLQENGKRKMFKLHQSGINCYSIFYLENDLALFATGGDDNCLILFLICLSSMEIKCTIKNYDKHVSQISGIHIDKNHIITTSIDQNVHVFEWSINKFVLTVNHIFETRISIADVQGMCCVSIMHDTFGMIFGHGVVFFKYKKENMLQ